MRLLITEAAREKLVEAMAAIGGPPLVACVGLSSGSAVTRRGASKPTQTSSLTSHWGVGFYRRETLSPDEIVVVSGVAFLHDDTLNGMTLDFSGGRFHVT
jgi:hypothetical protein